MGRFQNGMNMAILSTQCASVYSSDSWGKWIPLSAFLTALNQIMKRWGRVFMSNWAVKGSYTCSSSLQDPTSTLRHLQNLKESLLLPTRKSNEIPRKQLTPGPRKAKKSLGTCGNCKETCWLSLNPWLHFGVQKFFLHLQPWASLSLDLLRREKSFCAVCQG